MRPARSTPVSAEVAELLDRRAARLKKQPAVTQEASLEWLAEFHMAEEPYAVPLRQLRAAIPLKLVSPVPLASAHVIGVARFQGQLLTAFSLASILGVRGWRADPQVLLVLESPGGGVVAVDCEEVPRAVAVPKVALAAARPSDVAGVVHVSTATAQQLNVIQDMAGLLAGRNGAVHGR